PRRHRAARRSSHGPRAYSVATAAAGTSWDLLAEPRLLGRLGWQCFGARRRGRELLAHGFGDAERGRAVCRGLHGPELGLTLGRRHGYFPLTRRKRGLRFLAPAEALRVRLASIAPASFLLTPSLAAISLWTALNPGCAFDMA